MGGNRVLDNTGFNLWADGYDRSVGLSDENNTYPFAGYKLVLNSIYNDVLSYAGKTVLDIGFGTAVLTSKLYEKGCAVYGQDFSTRMIELAQEKMPDAKLYQGDFTKGLTEELKKNKYDAIIATYSLHHLTDDGKAAFLKELLPLLNDGGAVYIGDVAFETRAQLRQCKQAAGEGWDEDEIYFVYDELKEKLPNLEFKKMSHCAGVFTLRR